MFEKREIIVKGERHYATIFIERRNSIRASITKDGVNIRIPRHLSSYQKEKEIENLIEWGRKKIEEKEHLGALKKFYTNESYIRTSSKIYRLQIEIRDSQKNFAKIKDNIIIFKIVKKYSQKEQQAYISKQLRKLLAKAHEKELQTLVHKLNDHYFKKSLGKISFKYTKSRWGICNTKTHDIELCTKLLLAPRQVFEYVIIHELAHLIHADHSKRFWNVVKSVDPSYKQKVKWLKQNGKLLEI